MKKLITIAISMLVISTSFAQQPFRGETVQGHHIPSADDMKKLQELHQKIRDAKLENVLFFPDSDFIFGTEPIITIMPQSEYKEFKEMEMVNHAGGRLFATGYGTRSPEHTADIFDASLDMNLRDFNAQKLVIPREARQSGCSAIINIRFNVESDGKITNPELSKALLITPDGKIFEETEQNNIVKIFERAALDYVEKMPDFHPAQLRHNTVRETITDGNGTTTSTRQIGIGGFPSEKTFVQSVANVKLYFAL